MHLCNIEYKLYKNNFSPDKMKEASENWLLPTQQILYTRDIAAIITEIY